MVSIRQAFIQLGDLFTEDSDFLLQDFAGLLGGLTSLVRTTKFICLDSDARIKLTNALIAFREGLFELLDGVAMGGLSITEFHFQLMDAVLGSLQFFDLGTQPVSVREPFVQLGDMFAEDPDFLLQDFAGLLGSSTGLQGISNFVGLRGCKRIKFTNPLIAFRESPFKLLDGVAMGGLSITEFHFQLMDAVLGRLQLFDLGAQSVSIRQAFIQLSDLFAEDPDFLLQDLAGLLGGVRDLLGCVEFVLLDSGKSIEFPDAAVAFRESLFELLDGAAMGGLSVTEFHFQLMDAVLGRLQLFDLGAQSVSIRQAFIQLGDLFAEDPDFLLQDFAGLLGGLTSLVRTTKFICLGSDARIKLTNPLIAFREDLFKLLDGAAMGGLPITEFHFQLMDATSHRLQLSDLGAKALSGGEPFVQLGDLFTEDPDFLLQDFAGLLGGLTSLVRTTEFIRLGSGTHIKLTDPLIAFRKELFKLLNSAAMGGFPITEFDFQQMDSILCRFQLLHADSDLIPISQSLIELGDMFA